MTRKPLIITTAIALAGAISIAAAVVLLQNPSPPNVVLIIIDALRQDKLGAYGFSEETSPEIDRMARQGVRFDSVIAQSSWTRPSIGSMLTSQYPRTLGIYKEKDEVLPHDAVTLAEVLKEAGYTTIGATANANINSSFNFQQGAALLLAGERDGSSRTVRQTDRPEQVRAFVSARTPSSVPGRDSPCLRRDRPVCEGA
jgi:arylsulfatase A-like enzyme